MKTLLILDNTVLSNFALVGRAHWLPEIWPGALATSSAAWDELQAGIRLGRIPESDWSWLVVLTLTRKERATHSARCALNLCRRWMKERRPVWLSHGVGGIVS